MDLQKPKPESNNNLRQSGQSIAILALALIGLLSFVGIAVDVGFIFQRSSKLQSAVDAAALAGVTELSSASDTVIAQQNADQKAGQFLNANNIPISATISLESTTSKTTIGEELYSITVTWPVELFFLKLIGLEDYVLSRSATAAHFPQADIYASRRVDQGLVNTSNQSVFGPQICTSWGDPFSPGRSAFVAEKDRPYAYKYRILIPPDYPDDVLRIELFDPDSINAPGTGATVLHSRMAQLANPSKFPSTPVEMNCASGSPSKQDGVCNISTGEAALVSATSGITYDHINPFWTVRIDENRGNNTYNCKNLSGYTPITNTATRYSLFYYKQNADGTIEPIQLSSYTGQVNDGIRDSGEHDTDLRWVSPGAKQSFDQPVYVPEDPGSKTSFELNIANDLPDILTDVSNGNRYVYLNIQTISGGSENGFEVWAGPDDYVDTVPSDVNQRNLYILNNSGAHYSKGATVFGMGNLPMNSNISNRVEIPLMYIGPSMAGGMINVRIFDPDAGAEPPVVFYFDSIAYTPDNSWDAVDWDKTDWAVSYGGDNRPEFGCFRNGSGYGDWCNDKWVDYRIQIPGGDDCFDHPTRGEECIPFYGGRFSANYKGGTGDTYGWQIFVSGDPYLVE